MGEYSSFAPIVLGALVFIYIAFARDAKGLGTWSPKFITVAFLSSPVIGAVFCTGFSMMLYPFMTASLQVGKPIPFFPAITTVHIAIGGGALIFFCYTTVLFLVRYRVPNSNTHSRDASKETVSLVANIENPKQRIRPGDLIGSYRLEEHLGEGTFADVWRAKNAEREYAIKIPKRQTLSNRIDSPKAEADRWIAAGDHPNVAKIIEAAELPLIPKSSQVSTEKLFVIVMKYFSEGTLKDRLKTQRTLSPTESVQILLRLLAGLDFIHSKKLIHRDIKPANILMENGNPFLSDFGLSRFYDDTHTRAAGSPPYMSPEAILGKREAFNDVWAAGITLLELLHGAPPSDDVPIESILNNSRLPQPVKLCLNKALDRNLDNRVKTASEFRNLLEIALTSLQG